MLFRSDFDRYQNDLRTQRRSNRTLGAIVAMLSVCQLVALAVIVSIVGSERTVIVPPNIDRSFWVSKDKASREYLEQMAGYVTWLMLDVSPTRSTGSATCCSTGWLPTSTRP